MIPCSTYRHTWEICVLKHLRVGKREQPGEAKGELRRPGLQPCRPEFAAGLARKREGDGCNLAFFLRRAGAESLGGHFYRSERFQLPGSQQRPGQGPSAGFLPHCPRPGSQCAKKQMKPHNTDAFSTPKTCLLWSLVSSLGTRNFQTWKLLSRNCNFRLPLIPSCGSRQGNLWRSEVAIIKGAKQTPLPNSVAIGNYTDWGAEVSFVISQELKNCDLAPPSGT